MESLHVAASKPEVVFFRKVEDLLVLLERRLVCRKRLLGELEEDEEVHVGVLRRGGCCC